MEKKTYKIDRGVWAIGLTKQEVRMLLFWASKGIATSKGGSYEDVMPSFLKSLAKEVKFTLPFPPEFNSRMKEYKRKTRKRKINRNSHA